GCGCLERAVYRRGRADSLWAKGVGEGDAEPAGLLGWDVVVAVDGGVADGGDRGGLLDGSDAADHGRGLGGGGGGVGGGDAADHAGGLGGEGGGVAAEGLAGGDGEQVGAEAVELGEQVGLA